MHIVGGWGRFYINSFKDLELIEAYWSAKLQKTRARYKRKIEKALNIEHRKRLHRWEETWWSTAG
jgi:predicted transcriptional regulator